MRRRVASFASLVIRIACPRNMSMLTL